MNVERFLAKIDKTGECWMWLGSKTAAGYGAYNDKYAHRISFEMEHGPIEPGLVIDHMCHTRACVNPAHLRAVTIKQNVENRAWRAHPRGVTFDKVSQTWRAQVKHQRRNYNLGRFATIEDAAEAARKKRLELFTHDDLDRLVS